MIDPSKTLLYKLTGFGFGTNKDGERRYEINIGRFIVHVYLAAIAIDWIWGRL